MSAAVILVRRSSSLGRAFIAARACSPSGAAPNSMTSVRSFRNGVTVAIRSVRCARISASASEPGGGTMSATASTASRSSPRGTTASIDCHTCSSVSSPPDSVTSNSTSTAAARRAECRTSDGCRRFCSSPAAFSALDSRSVVISRSSSSRQSSTARPSR